MTEAILDWDEIYAAIKQELEGIQDKDGNPAFLTVNIGLPLGLPLGGPHVYAWYTGRQDAVHAPARATLGNVMYAVAIRVMVFWVKQSERDTLQLLEANITALDTNMRRAFRANSTINNRFTDLDISDSQTDLGPSPSISQSVQYRWLMFELILDNLEGEAIAP